MARPALHSCVGELRFSILPHLCWASDLKRKNPFFTAACERWPGFRFFWFFELQDRRTPEIVLWKDQAEMS